LSVFPIARPKCFPEHRPSMTLTRRLGIGQLGFPRRQATILPPERSTENDEKIEMSPFHQIEARHASRSALGILMPRGRRTLVILRPRSLDWDLVPVRPDEEPDPGTLFWEVSREEGTGLVSELHRSLEEWAKGGLGRVEPAPAPGGVGYHVRVGLGRLVL